jgi:hypothetical protein
MNLKRIGKGLGIGLGICVLVIVIGVVGSMATGSKNAAPVVDKDAAFSDSAKAHFAEVQSSIPELASIHGVDDTISSVVYFDFKTLPADAEKVIRGNASTFSTFSMQANQGSHVTVYGQLNGKTFLKCEAADGAVTQCTNN